MKKPYEENGCLYLFNNEKFDKIIKQKAETRIQIGTRSIKKVTQKDIMENLANDVNIQVSLDTVKKWKCKTSPSDLYLVKSIAKHLEIDYLGLLIPLGNQEDTMKHDVLTENDFTEKSVINSIFELCVEIIYKRSDITSIKSEQEFLVFLDNIRKDINKIHISIDKNSLDISDETRNKLHMFIFEFEYTFGFNNSICERWIDISNQFLGFVPSYPSSDRSEIIRHSDGCYLYDEIEYAERLGSTDIKMVPDEILEKYSPLSDITIFEKYGAQYISEYMDLEITPQMVYIDLMVNLIKKVIQNDFFLENDIAN